MSEFISFENVGKTYVMGEVTINALKNVNFTVKKGEICVILGPSGEYLLTPSFAKKI